MAPEDGERNKREKEQVGLCVRNWVCYWAYSTKSAASFIKNELLKGHTPKCLYFSI